MADEVDQSAERQELMERMRLREVQEQAGKQEVTRAKNGTCLWCEEKIPAPKRWCSSECRNDWQKYAPK